jgi:hypothetical protein
VTLTPSRFTRSFVAPLLAIVLAVPIGARPARAADPATVIGVITAAVKLIDALRGLRGGDKTIEQAKAEIINAVNSSKTQILAHVDALAATEAKACTRAAVIELADMDRLTQPALQIWAQNVTLCATRIDEVAQAVTDKAVSDQLGFALNITGPVAVLAREKAGLTTSGLTDFLVQANTRVQTKLNPACTTAIYTIIPGRRTSVTQCTGYNGVKAQSKCQLSMAHCAAGTPFVIAAKREASAMTSWKVADTAKVVFAGWAPAMAATRAGQNG